MRREAALAEKMFMLVGPDPHGTAPVRWILTCPARKGLEQSPHTMGWKKPDDDAYAFARGIIGKVSRTFALGIVVLPGDLGKAVLTGYLLCRIADTVEDDGDAPAQRRQALLARFAQCFDSPELAESFAQEAA